MTRLTRLAREAGGVVARPAAVAARPLTLWARTIRGRLTLWYTALLALALVVAGLLLLVAMERTLMDQLDEALRVQADALVRSLGQVDHEGLDIEGDALRAQPGTVVLVRDPTTRRLLADNTPSPLPAMTAALETAQRGATDLRTVAGTDGRSWRVLSRPLVDQGRIVGLLQVAQPVDGVREAVDSLRWLLLLVVPVTPILAGAGGALLAGRALRPVRRLADEVEALGPTALERRVATPRVHDEVGRLAVAFNGLLARLEAAFARQRAFAADASHELRTPVAVIRAHAELALERERSPEDYRAAFAVVREEARRLGRLIGDLMILARADAGRLPIERLPVDLAALVGEAVRAMDPLARERGIALSLVAPPGAGRPVVLGDQARLTQAVVNLVDNALKYTPAGGRVSVELAVEPSWATVRVRDSGPGIAAEHLPRLFERFYRVDVARGRDGGGAGLGLAIVEWVAQSHGGRVEVSSEPGRGSVFSLRLPVASGNMREASSGSHVSLILSGQATGITAQEVASHARPGRRAHRSGG